MQIGMNPSMNALSEELERTEHLGKPQSFRGWWQQVMGKGPGQDGKLSASERSNCTQQADVLVAWHIYQ